MRFHLFKYALIVYFNWRHLAIGLWRGKWHFVRILPKHVWNAVYVGPFLITWDLK
jgi:hypothetical protein